MSTKELLPIHHHRKQILRALKRKRVVVVESPTGSGKSTQLPIILYQAGFADKGRIGITQPRRIAAVSISAFVAQQMGAEKEELVAYKMRFEDTTTPKTKIKFVTDGTLLQEIKHDPLLSEYSVIMVDEAHERSVNIDFTVGLLKYILSKRHDLKVIISSATINARSFSRYYDNCKIVSIRTRAYPVKTVYTPVPIQLTKDSKYPTVEHAITTVGNHIAEHKSKKEAMLIFLTGEAQIRECIRLLNLQSYKESLHILPLFSRLHAADQEQVFLPPPEGKIKIVVATNIAETSITINEITAVIDSGLAKINYFNTHSNSFTLEECGISQSSADQRKGRAGRVRPGTCYRLYDEEEFMRRPRFAQEEIFRTDLSEIIMRMAELNISNFDSFDFLSGPNPTRIKSAVHSLRRIGALTNDNTLTDLGRQMAPFPLLPRHARIILEAIRKFPEVLEECICAVSFLTTYSPFLSVDNDLLEQARAAQRELVHPRGDFISCLNIFRRYQEARDKEAFCDRYYLDIKVMREITNINQQLSDIVSTMGIPISSGGGMEKYMAAVCSGLIDTICAKISNQSYQSSSLMNISIHPGSLLWGNYPSMIVAGEIVRTNRTYARFASPVKIEWLRNFTQNTQKKLYQLEQNAKRKAERIRLESRNRRTERGRRNRKQNTHIPKNKRRYRKNKRGFRGNGKK